MTVWNRKRNVHPTGLGFPSIWFPLWPRSWRQRDLMKSAEGSQMSKLFISTILGGWKVQSRSVNASQVFVVKHHCGNAIILHAKNSVLSRERAKASRSREGSFAVCRNGHMKFFSSSSLCLPRRPFKLFSHAISIIFSRAVMSFIAWRVTI